MRVINGTASNRRLHTCECSWFRDVTTDSVLLGTKIEHPVYGRVTWMEAATLDVKHHDCTNTEIARRVLQGSIRYAA